ncbi:HAD-IIA family hydrolase [Teredinibacter haidensis]|uniref:HAD-IIA family hydrolase n=1 Tax=Teredinibacter haidensis TaxID=2731755 RepID=UPI000948DA39|nr:HAD-IIA family hydrolase [Teredinibacter haidensis]
MSYPYGFLLDMDGVVYRGSTPIPGAVEVINRMITNHIPVLFLTNNSQKTRRDIAYKLNKMGIKATEKHIFTCAMSTARFLATQKPNGTAFVIGEGGLSLALHASGFSIVDENPDYVVVGEGRLLNFETLEKATRFVANGARLVATNLDASCPTEDGIRPGCGAITAMIEKATGRQAFYLGKPSGIMMRLARKELGLRTEDVVMVGDTMYTDIIGGVEMGYQTVLVLSGGTKESEVDLYSYKPTHIIPSIAELPELLPEAFRPVELKAKAS